MGIQEEFIFKIQPYVTAWKKQFGFGVVSAIIGQACLESAYGTSEKASYNNYFGLKYKPNRVTCSIGTFSDTSYEQRSDGSYYQITTSWYMFADMNTGVEGYFQFINTGNYSDAKNQTTPEGYLTALKNAGYATSKNYVENVMRVVNTYNLTQFDEEETPMRYHVDPNRKPDSPLAKAVWTDHYCTYPRQTKKKPCEFTIIPHCTAGNSSAESTARYFNSLPESKAASSHYIIDSKGVIVQNVPEDCRAYTTGGDIPKDKCPNHITGSEIDHESITIEIANITREPDWCMSAEAINSLVNLMVDICKRNGIPCLKYSANKALVGTPEQNVAAHRWFARKACPGNFLYNNLAAVVSTVNLYLGTNPAPEPVPTNGSYIINGLDYSVVFDPVYYSDKYSDLKAAFGTNADLLWNHFCDFGMNEFRQGSANFNPQVYKDNNPDVVNSPYGEDNFGYYTHFVQFGQYESRVHN